MPLRDTSLRILYDKRMRLLDGHIQLSSSDLVGHLNCRRLTELELATARGELRRNFRHDPLLDILRERGMEHEQSYVTHLRANGFEVVEMAAGPITPEISEATLAAMRRGASTIFQGAFIHGAWRGRTDILRRVEASSDLGAWSYEVVDTKLARETKGGTILQLCLYSELVGAAQGRTPDWMYVVRPWTDFQPQAFRVADYAAYFRHVKSALGTSIFNEPLRETYPEPKPHCDICTWYQVCDRKRRDDDHLCLVAGITKSQINDLSDHGVTTVDQLSTMALPLTWKPSRGSAQSFEKVREQARVQVAGRDSGEPIFELLPLLPGFGLSTLPEPSPGDIFFDLEGDPFAGEGGLEYLFGSISIGDDGKPEYTGHWAANREEERRIFENFIDHVISRWERHPDMHIYHYAPYEPSALKRLMGRYATRENEVDQMLRGKLFVDLYSVVRHSIRASVESYSIKKLEAFYGYERNTPLQDVGGAMAHVQAGLELNRPEGIPDEAKRVVTDYNRDDCISTLRLRDWLEEIRIQQTASGVQIDRPAVVPPDPSDEAQERTAKLRTLIERLTHDVPDDVNSRTREQQAKWILANILDFHWREEKSTWWEFFRLCELPEEDLLDERAALAGLEFISNVNTTGKKEKVPVHRYRFPAQETDFRGGEDLYQCGGTTNYGKVVGISIEQRTIDIKKRGDTASTHASSVFAHTSVSSKELAAALLRIGEYVATHGFSSTGTYAAACGLLLKSGPHLVGSEMQRHGEKTLDAAIRIVKSMGAGILPIQGPPGAGKTYTGAQMICELVRSGKKVGITANSHKVIRNLIDGVIKAGAATGVDVSCIQKVKETEDTVEHLSFTTDNRELFDALSKNRQVAGGTAWLWAREEAAGCVDVLFVDEAAQMSLAKVLAVSHAAKCLVLLGDPQQLDQPTQGSHPDGTDVSALTHILDGHQTIPADKGLFLEETWRLHPEICAFTSEVFYEGRLTNVSGTQRQVIRSTGSIAGTGLRYLPVPHAGNQNSSPEEAERIHDLVTGILDSGTTWIDSNGHEHALRLDDILIIAPYNAQVFELTARLPKARIGTVDKFQGQEAPIAIYSMATSTHADAPRGMEFLYSLNRLNVATSRAKCISILVGSAALFEADCRTPRQMQLANAFCRFLELAETVR